MFYIYKCVHLNQPKPPNALKCRPKQPKIYHKIILKSSKNMILPWTLMDPKSLLYFSIQTYNIVIWTCGASWSFVTRSVTYHIWTIWFTITFNIQGCKVDRCSVWSSVEQPAFEQTSRIESGISGRSYRSYKDYAKQ